MNLNQDVIVGRETEEAEERNAPEAKQVEACAFQAQRAGSSPVGSTDDWCVEKIGNRDFNIIKTTATICGRDHGRLGIQT